MKEETVTQPADKDKSGGKAIGEAGGKTCSKCGGSGRCLNCMGNATGCGPCNGTGECPKCDGTGTA